MSALPSPSKSPEPLTCQLAPGLPPATGPLVTAVPFIIHSPAWPLPFCHRMSDLPSPSKSPDPLTCQLVPGLEPTSGPLGMAVPFMNQIPAWPESFCHTMSDIRSPSKSDLALPAVDPPETL